MGDDDWDDWGSGGGGKSSAKKGGDDDWDDWGGASAGKKSSDGKKASGLNDWDEPAEKKKAPSAAAKPAQRERKDSWGDEAPARPKAAPPKKAAADDWVRRFDTHTCIHTNMYIPSFPFRNPHPPCCCVFVPSYDSTDPYLSISLSSDTLPLSLQNVDLVSLAGR